MGESVPGGGLLQGVFVCLTSAHRSFLGIPGTAVGCWAGCSFEKAGAWMCVWRGLRKCARCGMVWLKDARCNWGSRRRSVMNRRTFLTSLGALGAAAPFVPAALPAAPTVSAPEELGVVCLPAVCAVDGAGGDGYSVADGTPVNGLSFLVAGARRAARSVGKSLHGAGWHDRGQYVRSRRYTARA